MQFYKLLLGSKTQPAL